MSPLAEDVGGSVDRTTGALTITTTQRTAVYLISLGDVPHPCPRCVSGVCTDGARSGIACTPSTSLDQTSLDCPPADSSPFLVLGPGTSQQSNLPKSRPMPAGSSARGR